MQLLNRSTNMEEKMRVNRTISILYRLGHMYFDRDLEPYQIGSGQQFFLLTIGKNPGISLYELAQHGCYDKGTTTRAVRKLEEEGFIRRVIDTRDKRYHQLYITDKAERLIPVIEQSLEDWNAIITDGLDEKQQESLIQLTEQLAINASKAVMKDRKRDKE